MYIVPAAQPVLVQQRCVQACEEGMFNAIVRELLLLCKCRGGESKVAA